ncbi:acylphosphatase (plasmid) [Rhizobium ruizarguesonis]|jgi:acylphosphatase|nr:acylphosphatase [Rhizobium ruizarguesonis]UFW97921.1 acylphosphatase [Rhizobium ruizarguesonis]
MLPQGFAKEIPTPYSLFDYDPFPQFLQALWCRKARASMRQDTSYLLERMTIVGDLEVASFVPWIRRHAAKLGLSHTISHTSSMRIELEVAGPVELIDMMEMGCSLGPIDVWVERIERTALSAKRPSAGL